MYRLHDCYAVDASQMDVTHMLRHETAAKSHALAVEPGTNVGAIEADPQDQVSS